MHRSLIEAAALDGTTPAAWKAEIEQRLKVYRRQDTWGHGEVAYFLTRAGAAGRSLAN